MTLPLIYTLNSVDKKLKTQIINTIKNYHKDDKKVAEVIALVKENGGLEYAKKIMNSYHKSALDILTAFEDNQAKKSLILLLDYVVNRKK
jgi:octaprenyl-diphosphate synthase